MNFTRTRRSFLSILGASAGSLLGPKRTNASSFSAPRSTPQDGNPIVPIRRGLGSTGNIYAELGVTPLINTMGTYTVIGGSVMDPEVLELIRLGNEHCVSIDDLEVAAGRFIARICKSPAGYTGLVTGGAAAALVVGYAGMMTEDLEPRLVAIPDLTDIPKYEVIIQKSHRYPFDHQIRQTGAKLIEVETREEMIAAINPRTVGIHFTNILSDRGKVGAAETIAIAKQHRLYTFNDAAADVPPKERLWTFAEMGFDLVTFSGGKDIRGPQASGLLIGKENLIRYALMNMSPQEDRIGRCCKVGKETIFGFLKALERFVEQDFDDSIHKLDAMAAVISAAIAKYGVTPLPRDFDPNALGNVTPTYRWRIDPAKLRVTGAEVMHQLAETRPLAIGDVSATAGGLEGRNPDKPAHSAWPKKPSGDAYEFKFLLWQLKAGEEKIVAERLAEIFASAPKA